jgi:hypothetical protein
MRCFRMPEIRCDNNKESKGTKETKDSWVKIQETKNVGEGEEREENEPLRYKAIGRGVLGWRKLYDAFLLCLVLNFMST